MNHSERFALEHFLSKIPDNKSFDEVLSLMEERSDEVCLGDLYEHREMPNMVGLILNMVHDIEKQFFPYHELVTLIDKDTVRDALTIELGRMPIDDEISRVCTFLDNDFSYQLQEKISDAITYLSIPKEGAV